MEVNSNKFNINKRKDLLKKNAWSWGFLLWV